MTQSYDYTCFDAAEENWVLYEGNFKNDDKQGPNGRLVLSNGEKYEGDFNKDMIDGKGVFYTMDGTKILGEWKENCLVRVITKAPPSNRDD